MKNIHSLICILCLSLAWHPVKAQYTAQGVIEFEKKVNLHRQMEDFDNKEFLERIKSQIPKFNSSFFNLYFNLNESLYKLEREPENPFKLFGGSAPASRNTVYTDFKKQQVVANKDIFEQTFLVNDTMRKIDWKMSDEVRTICNYTCRKAVGKICDSVYVVAFYTDDIMVSGGPEMFSGLPGMILEIAIPRLYTTWVATKVSVVPPAATVFVQPAKGKKTNQKELEQSLQSSLKDWGKFASRNIWWCIL